MHGEGGQATVEWVGLVLAAALVLAGAGALAGREADRGLGEEVAGRITRAADAPAAGGPGAPAAAAPGDVVRKRPTSGRFRTTWTDTAPRVRAAPPPQAAAPPRAPPPQAAAPPPPQASAPPPAPSAPPPPASGPRAVPAFRSLRGVADVARHAWIVCLGYRRWQYELEHPSAPTEALPVDVALGIVNDCFNPHDYLLED